MLTAATARDRVDGLNLGADDYLMKPFAFAELVARVRAHGRRAASATPVTVRGDLVFDRARRRVSRGGRALGSLLLYSLVGLGLATIASGGVGWMVSGRGSTCW